MDAKLKPYYEEIKNDAIVTKYYDHTIREEDGSLQSWDNYILDDDILFLLHMLYQRKPDIHFAKGIGMSPERKYYFSPPYSEAAIKIGYGEDSKQVAVKSDIVDCTGTSDTDH